MNNYKDLNKLINQKVDKIVKKAGKDFDTAIEYTNHELWLEATKMYDSFIDQFYNYKTKSYIRHGESQPGTQRGINLYRGQQIKEVHGSNPKLIINFSGDDMEGGYQYDTADNVLNYVMWGVRFPYYDTMSWSGSYKGKYYKFSGTMHQAFDNFETLLPELSRDIFLPMWKRLGW